MNNKNRSDIQYSIWNPAGNITALVECSVCIEDQTEVAARIMELHPDVEQVGFVQFSVSSDDPVQIRLRMAGGEFCGNASMSAACLYNLFSSSSSEAKPLNLQVSGTFHPIKVWVCKSGSDYEFSSSITMPPAFVIEKREFKLDDVTTKLPMVRMEGITHVIVEHDSLLFALKESPEKAEQAVRAWCNMLSVECLGLMFLEKHPTGYFLTPLVYVPACNTVFWEKSCASGSAAVGIYLAEKAGSPMNLPLTEPGGLLRVEVDLGHQKIRLFEKIRYIKSGIVHSGTNISVGMIKKDLNSF